MRDSLENIFYTMFVDAPWYKKMAVLRAMYGWTMTEAAEKCGTGLRIYWSWENGKTKPIRNNKKMIAEAFNVSEEDLFGEKGSFSS